MFFCDVVKELSNHSAVCDLVETVFLSQNCTPLCQAAISSKLNKHKTEPLIKIVKLDQGETLSGVLKQRVRRQFGTGKEFSNQMLTELLSDPIRSKITLGYASYTDQSIMPLNIRELCKDLTQNHQGAQICYLSFPCPKTHFTGQICKHQITFSSETGKPTESQVEYLNPDDSYKAHHSEIAAAVQKCTQRIIRRLPSTISHA